MSTLCVQVFYSVCERLPGKRRVVPRNSLRKACSACPQKSGFQVLVVACLGTVYEYV